MSHKETQPGPPGKSLDTQIDTLMSEVVHTKANEAKAGAHEAKPSAAHEPPAPVKPAANQDVSGDALADQIQDLLDDAKKAGANAAAGTGVEQIDQALADDADKAIEGDFETTAEAGVKSDAADTNTSATAAHSSEAAAGTVEEPADAEPDLEGAFSSPEDLLKDAANASGPAAVQTQPPTGAPKSGRGFSADAAAVGRELDEQLQDRPLAAAPPNPPRNPRNAQPAKTPKTRKKIDALASVRGVFVLVNKPLLGCSAQTRSIIGWIGLMTLFNGSVLLASHVIFPSRNQAAAASEVATAEPTPEAPSKEGGAKHDKDKEKEKEKPKPKQHEKPKKPEKKAKKTEE